MILRRSLLEVRQGGKPLLTCTVSAAKFQLCAQSKFMQAMQQEGLNTVPA